jgi:hypothetical protein
VLALGTVPAGVCFETLSHGSDSATCVADFAVVVEELVAEFVGVDDADVSGAEVDGLALNVVDACCPQAARAKAEQATTAMATGFIDAYVSTHSRHRAAGACVFS